MLYLMEEVNLNDDEDTNIARSEDVTMVHGRQTSVIDLSGRCSEIIVHEVDTDSDAGSEDVELLPHRYAASSDDCGGHLYVNRLSLATELLRTREPLPYDEDLKLGEPSGETESDGRTKGESSTTTNSDSEKNEKPKPQNSGVKNGYTSQKESSTEPLRLHVANRPCCGRQITPLLTNNIQQCPCTII